MAINKINSLAIASVAKVNSLLKASMAKINSLVNVLFADSNAVSKALATGVDHAINIEDTDGNFNFQEDDAFTFSIWVKAGWSSSLNTNLHFWAMNDGSSGNNDQKIKCFYNESNNRLYLQYSSDSSNKRENFWYFHHTGSGEAAEVSGLGTSSYWSASNRGNVGDNNFTMITITKGASDSAATSNLKAYWNGTSLGDGYYASGNSSGTPSMSTADRRLCVGCSAHQYAKTGDGEPTVYNDFTIWNAALTAGEVSELYNSGTRLNATTHSAASSLVGYYQFESDGSDTSGQSAPTFEISGDSAVVGVEE